MADQAVTISRETRGEDENLRGRYVARAADSEAEAELTWYRDGEAQGEDVRVADHTFTPPQLRGRGIAKELVKALVADAQKDGFRIVPACSYVAQAFRDHPEWSDLKASL
ncbi:MAG: N-acetyltransferase [Erythrobacter sp.]|nr:N-acetyltransferase [Erythrobacter sp.]